MGTRILLNGRSRCPKHFGGWLRHRGSWADGRHDARYKFWGCGLRTFFPRDRLASQIPRLLLLATLAPAVAHADILPPPAAVISHRPLPKAFMPVLDLNRRSPALPGPPAPMAEADLDVRLVSEEVSIEAYPTLLQVKIRSILRAGDSLPESIELGFPVDALGVEQDESLLDKVGDSDDREHRPTRIRGMPLQFLTVKINGEAVAPQDTQHPDKKVEDSKGRAEQKTKVKAVIGEKNKPAKGDATSRISGGLKALDTYEDLAREPWKSWRAQLEPGRDNEIEVTYTQGLYAEMYGGPFLVPVVYSLWTSSLWRGPVGRSEVNIHLHGLWDDEVRLRTPVTERTDGHLVWRFDEREPVGEEIVLLFELSRARVTADSLGLDAYDVSALPPHLQLMDRLVRFGRGLPHDLKAWESVLEDLRNATAPGDEVSRLYAASVLNDLHVDARREISGHDELECSELLPLDHGLRAVVMPQVSSAWIPHDKRRWTRSFMGQQCVTWHHEASRRRLVLGVGGGLGLCLGVLGFWWRRRR